MAIRILLVDDEEEKRDLYKMTIEAFKDEEPYIVDTAASGEEALRKLEENQYHLVLLDIYMSGKDGHEVLKEIRSNIKTRNIPVIILTASSNISDEIKSIDQGADDFLNKDADDQVIQARIKNTLKKHRFMMGLNPLTQLPGNLQIDEEINKRISDQTRFAIGYVDLDHFKEFNDTFGFSEGDKAIRLTAEILYRAILKYGNKNDFLGHVGGDDFIFITTPDRVEIICEWIVKTADLNFKKLFPAKIQKEGYYTAKNRKGVTERIPILTLSIAVVHNGNKTFGSLAEIASTASEIKKKAKSIAGNSYYIDRRRN
jgi:diguanylate cyclase (GGDEF)-like protein